MGLTLSGDGCGYGYGDGCGCGYGGTPPLSLVT